MAAYSIAMFRPGITTLRPRATARTSVRTRMSTSPQDNKCTAVLRPCAVGKGVGRRHPEYFGIRGSRAAVRKVRIHLPPAESQVRTCLSREFAFPGRETAVFRGCPGRDEWAWVGRDTRGAGICGRKAAISLSGDRGAHVLGVSGCAGGCVYMIYLYRGATKIEYNVMTYAGRFRYYKMTR